METLETVIIKGENGPIRINKSDFDEKTMKIHKEPKTAAKKKPAVKKKPAPKKTTNKPAAPAGPNTVIEEDGTFFVVDSEGNKTADTEGYETNAEAWKAAVPENT